MPSETVTGSCPGVKHHFSVGSVSSQETAVSTGCLSEEIQAAHVMKMSLSVYMQPDGVFFNYYPLNTQEG